LKNTKLHSAVPSGL